MWFRQFARDLASFGPLLKGSSGTWKTERCGNSFSRRGDWTKRELVFEEG
jgi:hypothetical protein